VGDDDVYVSAAQIKRCELVSGDRISGPVRSPRRSERHPSLVRVTTINGRSADEVAEGTRFEDLRAVFPSEPLELGGELELVDRLSPIGKGSRVAIAGEPHTGKSELLRRAAQALAGARGPRSHRRPRRNPARGSRRVVGRRPAGARGRGAARVGAGRADPGRRAGDRARTPGRGSGR
jgi:hypothetical protein